jgi:hypothetical protein
LIVKTNERPERNSDVCPSPRCPAKPGIVPTDISQCECVTMAVDSKTLNTLNAIWKQFATDDPILLNNAATTLNRMMRSKSIHPDEVPLSPPNRSATLANQLRNEERLRRAAEIDRDTAQAAAKVAEKAVQDLKRKLAETEKNPGSRADATLSAKLKIAEDQRQAAAKAAQELSRRLAEMEKCPGSETAKRLVSENAALNTKLIDAEERLARLESELVEARKAAQASQGQVDAEKKLKVAEVQLALALEEAARAKEYRKALEYAAEFVSTSVLERCLYQGRQYADEAGIIGDVTWSRRGEPRAAKQI